MNKLPTLFGALLLASPAALPASEPAKPAAKPNIVFILIDDMGWTDVGCFGSKIYQTPNIDKLAAQGMRFTDAYAACNVCSPTRASILTGKYPARLHLTDWIPGKNIPNAKLKIPDWTMHLPLEETTLAEALKPAGYVSACIGKWHLGDEAYYPEKQGFEVNIGGYHKGHPQSYFSPYKNPKLPNGPNGEYLTDRLAAEAENFIKANKNKPFFLYLPNYAVHTPLEAKKEYVDQYLARGLKPKGQNSATYAAMIQSVDDGVGRVMKTLDDLGIAENTVVIFMSDNGGLARSTSNAPLRAGKGTAYEGGVREPMIVKWPGVTKPGSECSVPVISMDFFPTILEMCNVAQSKPVDGVSITSLLKGGSSLSREALFWHYPHYHETTPYGVVRAGDYKLIEYFEDNHLELYNLKDDIGETKDLSKAMPDKTAELVALLRDWRKSVNAQMPTPNPGYDPAKSSGKGKKKGNGGETEEEQ